MQPDAAAGYVVFYDTTGSSGYGEAFGMLLHNKYSSPDDFADHDSGVDAMVAAGIADPDNLFITGGSAGGIASAYAIGLTDRFRAAAVAEAGRQLDQQDADGRFVYRPDLSPVPGHAVGGIRALLAAFAVIAVGNMVTPTMLITGEEDYRTPDPKPSSSTGIEAEGCRHRHGPGARLVARHRRAAFPAGRQGRQHHRVVRALPDRPGSRR